VVGQAEEDSVSAALRSGWVAPVGPDLDAFEADIAALTGRKYVVALSSGTAALHLALKAVGVSVGQEVLVPTMTFAASAFAVRYLGAEPTFLDSERNSWNLDPSLLRDVLKRRYSQGKSPAAVMAVDVFGRTCDYVQIAAACQEFGIPLIVDSAESLGATCGTAHAGSVGDVATVSFNGNKIVTTGGGGALVTDNEMVAQRVRKWASQSREPVPWYEHKEVGFNYRLSNIAAALGRAQLTRLADFIERKRWIHQRYEQNLMHLGGVTLLGDPPWGTWNGWLTIASFDLDLHPDAPKQVREALEQRNIESRPVWKPMHMQPVFRENHAEITGVADEAFARGLCLPSGASMSEHDVDRVSDLVLYTLQSS
jgi:dTDP-4-amino-4,6-dideoxygalactose transaminase